MKDIRSDLGIPNKITDIKKIEVFQSHSTQEQCQPFIQEILY